MSTKYYVAIGIGTGLLLFLLFLGVDVLPFVGALVLIGLFLWFSQDSGGKLKLGKSKKEARVTGSVPDIRFEEIGGQERAKRELKEALDFLIFEEQRDTYGIRPLKGILLYGPPGTGKTLMAKAAANYTQSVFLAASGSEFIEMYVGVGAQRIRELFQQAFTLAKKKQTKSAIIFIDEIDVIGGKRQGSQHKEYDQTLNQLLTEMDGITKSEIDLLVIAATNRIDILDPALLRPGRFDRRIAVDLPDRQAREKILTLHLQNKPLHPSVQLDKLAQQTFGLSGAQLESVTNEAAIYAMRDRSEQITDTHLSNAIDKVLMGEQSDRESNQEEKERVAVHELGHAIIAELNQSGSVAQVALTPRGQALGYVRHHEPEDRHLHTKKDLERRIQVCLAGAAAEELYYEEKSTGAKNDYDQANSLAKAMVETGLSTLGIIDPNLAPKDQIQAEMHTILAKQYEETLAKLRAFSDVFQESLDILLTEERLSGEGFRKLLQQKQKKIGTIDEAT
ncbi:AAA family ATPase [Risungbinella massiliensis]|uniref:AAA family ATPase n=1 Tax=Risungbinella massiliensis TaxID=1329796 RepID=UPI0005CB99BB|nr:AAA family ATPase [Risungbinella massiliensis]